MGDATLDALPGDASARRYFRLVGQGKLLMEDRDDPVAFAAFVRLADHLAALGLSAPKIFGADPASGLALIEDFGKDTYGALLNAGYDEEALYALAIDALIHLHSSKTATAVKVPTYDTAVLLDEISIFSQWFGPALQPDCDAAAFDQTFREFWADAFGALADQQTTLVLRDFHVDNLILLQDREGVHRCGLLDFQDAVLGAPEYDLMSLLQDARRDLTDGLEEAMLARYLSAIPEVLGTPEQIMVRYHLLAAQRHTRIAGLFLRLNKRDGKSGYLRFMPRVLGQMQNALEAAGLREILAFLDESLPGWRNAGPHLAQAN